MAGHSEILGAKVTFYMGTDGSPEGRVYHVKLKPLRLRTSDGTNVMRFQRGEVEHQPKGGMNAAQMELRIIETELLARLVDEMIAGREVEVELEIG